MTDKEKQLKKQLRKLQKAFCKASLILSEIEYYDGFSKDYPFDKSFDEMALEVDTWIEGMYPSLKIVKGTAIYTGGGIYIIIGKLNDGNYVISNIDWFEVVNSNPMEYEHYEDERYFDDCQWINKHKVTNQYQRRDILRAIKKFCKNLDNGEGDKYIIDEFKNTSNYAPGELVRMVYKPLKEY